MQFGEYRFPEQRSFSLFYKHHPSPPFQCEVMLICNVGIGVTYNITCRLNVGIFCGSAVTT